MFGLPRIEIGDGFFRQISVTETHIDALEASLDNFKEPLEDSLRNVILPSIEENFARQGRPLWQRLAIGTIENRMGSSHPVLYWTGDLFKAVLDPVNWEVTRDHVQLVGLVGKVKYAAFHQLGTKNMPARPFVMFHEEDVNKIADVFEHWVDRQVEMHWGMGEL